MQKQFRRFAEKTSSAVGTHWAFMAAIGIIAAWGAADRFFGFSQQWQLIINSERSRTWHQRQGSLRF